MSLRKNKSTKRELSNEELNKLRSLEAIKLHAEASGLNPDQTERLIAAEDQTAEELGDMRLREGYEEIAFPEDIGQVIVNPVSKKYEGVLDKEGNLRNMDGTYHPATQAHKKKIGI